MGMFFQKVTYPALQVVVAVLLLFLLTFVSVPFAVAEGWHVEIRDLENIPHSFAAIDKNKQQLHVLNKHSPLSVSVTYPCTTGKVPGDKQVEGDLKTPEGVYFVGRKLTELDFEEYGGVAYTLNYPNPVDRLRQKTGYGIWIHSKGHEIVPRETMGCIALNLPDLEEIGDSLISGYPVTVADKVDTNIVRDEQTAATAALLEQQVRLWAKLWSDRSPAMFDLYHGQSYSLAQINETFEQFTAVKRSLFGRLAWIHTIITDVKVLPGPGYWVTWFNQFYRAPNHTTEGIRRLYWQEMNGKWLIVGMEWSPRDLGLSANYLEVIEPGLTAFLEEWRKAWENADLDGYAGYYADNAVQGKLGGRRAIRDFKKNLWGMKKPAEVSLNGIRLATSSDGIQADMEQVYRDSSGYSDKGIKTLTLQPSGDSWVIVREEWQGIGKNER